MPSWLDDRFDGLDEDVVARKAIAAEVALELCEDLQSGGVDQFHFYTLNQADLTLEICRNLGKPDESKGINAK